MLVRGCNYFRTCKFHAYTDTLDIMLAFDMLIIYPQTAGCRPSAGGGINPAEEFGKLIIL